VHARFALYIAGALAGCAPAVAVTSATASVPGATAAAPAPSSARAASAAAAGEPDDRGGVAPARGGATFRAAGRLLEEYPDRDPQARGAPGAFYAADVPDDRDGDGVPDALDACPEVPSDRVHGCPRPR
jgi:hypothetical protein